MASPPNPKEQIMENSSSYLAVAESDGVQGHTAGPRFGMTYCSQCGRECGPGDAGVSNCYEHSPELRTPLGPFRFLEDGRTEDEANEGRPLTICDEQDNDAANVFSEDDSTVFITRDKAIETARLFAASPDLLEALRRVLMHARAIEADAGGRSALINVRAAIARATGAA
jgi:hypothetical protein